MSLYGAYYTDFLLNYSYREQKIHTRQDDQDKPLEVKKNDLTTNVSKKAKAKGSSKHNKARKQAFLARKKKRRKNK